MESQDQLEPEPIKESTTLEGEWSLGPNYQILKELGHGSYGRVYEAVDTRNGKRVAIKKFIRALSHPQLAQYCLREVEIMAKIVHPNIVKMHDIIHSNHSVYIVMDHMPFDLKKLIYSDTYLDHDQVKALMYEIMISINYLHSSKLVHRDVKPGNILAAPDCSAKLCDFGLARSICGLKITAFDFDEIYRREFAESNEHNLVADITGMADTEEKPEDLDEHVMVNTKLAMPGYFDVNMKQVKRTDKVPELIKLKPKLKSIKQEGILKTGSLGSMAVKQAEEQKGGTALPLKAMARREEFIKTMKQDPLMEREMTTHIASRWYRAPEVILLEKVYCGPVDIWGVGCVFAELLEMIKENKPASKDRTPLFPGTCCFPLSPQLKQGNEGEVEYFQQGEQLITICKLLGTPSEADIAFITDPGAKHYVSLLPKCPGVRLNELYPNCTEDELDLLNKMLAFNPFGRITAKEALRHSYFKSIRNKAKEAEGVAIPLSTKVPDTISIQNLKEYCETLQIHDNDC